MTDWSCVCGTTQMFSNLTVYIAQWAISCIKWPDMYSVCKYDDPLKDYIRSYIYWCH